MEQYDLKTIMIDSTTNAKDASAIQFVSWVLQKVNESKVNNSMTIELNMMAAGYPGRNMPESAKIELLNKMKTGGIPF